MSLLSPQPVITLLTKRASRKEFRTFSRRACSAAQCEPAEMIGLDFAEPAMKQGGRLGKPLFVCGLCLALSAAQPAFGQQVTAAPPVTPPKEHFGFNLGDDYCLANYQQLMSYFAKLERESDRFKVVRIGVTEEGRPQLMGIVTSPANHRRLVRFQDIARRLARAEGVSEAEARELAAEGKAVVWIDGGLHASEVLCAQALMQTIYQLLSANDAETLRFLDDVIILFVHANPDGMDLCADWYMREADPKKRSLAGLPRLYQKYIGHDNNRDFYGFFRF